MLSPVSIEFSYNNSTPLDKWDIENAPQAFQIDVASGYVCWWGR